jgi:predicted TIM-barrel fold metal-dependent hydrolase
LVIDESFRAVKFDPTAHGYLPQRCDDVIGPILEEAAGLRVPALFEMGNPPFSTPVLTAVLAEAHPRTTIVLCNLGSDNVVYAQEAAYVAAMNRNVFLTTAGATMPRLRQVIAALGPDRVLFASGFPRHDAASQLRLVEALGEAGPVGPAQSSEALDLVLSGNFRRLFGADSALATPA